MAEIRTFCAVHPAEGLASKLAALPYDVYSRDEAREQVKKSTGKLSGDRPPGDPVSKRSGYVCTGSLSEST